MNKRDLKTLFKDVKKFSNSFFPTFLFSLRRNGLILKETSRRAIAKSENSLQNFRRNAKEINLKNASTKKTRQTAGNHSRYEQIRP